MRAPLACRALIRVASWMVPARARAAWLSSRFAELFAWWRLVERGEPVRYGGATLCRRAFADALSQRVGGADPLHFFRSPLFLLAAAAACLLALGAVSHGFEVTRRIAAIAADIRANPPKGYDSRGDRVAVYVGPVFLALTVGLSVLAAGCFTLRARGWRYWSFLFVKAFAVIVILPLVWAELGTTLRNQFHGMPGRGLTGLITAIALIIVMARTMIWCIADQRRRCRICLRRMVLPVSVGSWGSLFEPSTTEMLCEQGHGALALSDAEIDVHDRWTRLDDSWKTLFR